MQSVERYLLGIRNLRTKAKILGMLRSRNAAKSKFGLVYKYKTFRLVHIY